MVDLVSSFSRDGKFRFSCEGCEKRYSVAPAALGRKGTCSKCNQEILVPNPSYDVKCDDARFFSVTLLKAKSLGTIDCFDPEVAYALVDDTATPFLDVFPLEAIQAKDSAAIVCCRVDDSLITELREIYPEEKDPFVRVDGSVWLASVTATVKSARDEEYLVSLKIGGGSFRSAPIHIYPFFSNSVSDEGHDRNLRIFRYTQKNSEYLFWIYGRTGGDAFVHLYPNTKERIISNMHSHLPSDMLITVGWTTSRGIIIKDEIALSGSVLERLLLMVDPKLRSTFGGLRSFDARSKVAFFEQKEKKELPDEEIYDEVGNQKVVYILVNPTMPGIVKIGRTTQGVRKRMEQLNTTGVAQPYECFYAAFVHDDVEVEKALHEHFSEFRVNQRREFFEVLPQKVMRELFKFDQGDASES